LNCCSTDLDRTDGSSGDTSGRKGLRLTYASAADPLIGMAGEF